MTTTITRLNGLKLCFIFIWMLLFSPSYHCLVFFWQSKTLYRHEINDNSSLPDLLLWCDEHLPGYYSFNIFSCYWCSFLMSPLSVIGIFSFIPLCFMRLLAFNETKKNKSFGLSRQGLGNSRNTTVAESWTELLSNILFHGVNSKVGERTPKNTFPNTNTHTHTHAYTQTQAQGDNHSDINYAQFDW